MIPDPKIHSKMSNGQVERKAKVHSVGEQGKAAVRARLEVRATMPQSMN